jgi:hypothetical protein
MLRRFAGMMPGLEATDVLHADDSPDPPAAPDQPALLPHHAQFGQLRRDILTSGRCPHALIDVDNPSVWTDVERPSCCHTHRAQDAVRLCSFFRRIRKDRIIGVDVLGKFLVGFRVVYAHREVGDIECANRGAALTERLAFRRSATGERFWEPRQYDSAFAFEISKRVNLAVGAWQAEGGRRITHFQHRGLLRESQQPCGHAERN